MLSDKQKKSTGYLNSISTNEAKPFLYRRGIRLLLGIPENKGIHLSYTPVLPPPGFRYANHQFWDGPYISQPSLNGNDRISLYPMQKGNNEHLEKNDVLKKAIVQHEVLTETTETKPEKIFIEANGKSGGAGVMIENAKIKIPGNSERSHNFPESPSFKRIAVSSNKVNEQCQYEVSSSEVSENLIKKSESKGQLHSYSEHSTAKIAPASKKSEIKETGKIMNNIETVYDGVSPAVKKHKRMPLQQTKASGFTDVEKTGVKPYQSFGAYKTAGYGIDNSSSIKAADKIEQLRQAVQVLASKKVVQQEKAENEKKGQLQEQTQPLTQREVVIIKRPLNRIRSPLAFWERSYLGHFHLRPLR